MLQLFHRIALALVLGTPVFASAAPAPVRVENGLVEGTQDGALAVYLGIPFAAPPVGPLRWRPPEPAADWTGVRPAKEYAATPIQKLEAWEGPLHVSEDCLYLNVWSPASSSRDGLPVIVWIYGGGFSGGSTAIGQYHSEPLARHGVVVVSIGYRVGALGFLALPDRKSTRLNSSHLVISYAVFCFNDPATAEIYPLSLHAALPISVASPWPAMASWW